MTGIAIRNLDVIAIEINIIKDQTRKVMAAASAEIGKRLVEAKELVAHGEWAGWLESNVDYSQSTAVNLMRIYQDYGADSQLLESLTYSQAVQLLALPAEERAEFVENNDMSDISTSELKQAIKDLQEAERKLQNSEQQAEADRFAKDEADAALAALNVQQEEYETTIARLSAEISDAKNAKDDKAVIKLRDDLKKSKEAASEATKRMKELEQQLKAKPIDVAATVEVIPEETKKELEDLRKREQELKAEGEQKAAAAAKQLSDLQDQLAKNNNVAMIKVKVCLESLTGNFKELISAVADLPNEEQRKSVKERIAGLIEQVRDGM